MHFKIVYAQQNKNKLLSALTHVGLMHYALFLLVDCPELGKHAVAVSDYITDRRKSMEPNVLQYL